MKNPIHSFFIFLAIVTAAFFTTGCPVGIPHPLGNPGTEKIDAKLLGVWVAKADSAEMQKLEIGKKDDFTYSVDVLETGENYMVDSEQFEAWITTIDGIDFIYARATDQDEELYFVYQYSVKGKKLAVQDVSLLIGGLDAVTDMETFRKEVSASLKMPDCLTSRLEYEKHAN